VTPADISPEYRAALKREAQAAIADPAHPPIELPKQAIGAIDAPPQPPMSWLIRDLWPAAQIGLFVGDGGAFKSSAALHMACAIAGGYSVFERYRVERAAPVLIVSAEDDLAVVLMRLEAFIAGHEWDRDRVMSNVHIIADGEPSLGEAVWKLHLLGEAERIRPGFIILDPWAELMGGDENSNTDARPAIKYLRRLATVSGAGVAVVHHAGKAGAAGKARPRSNTRRERGSLGRSCDPLL
jgi:RecA-family ATPase